MNTDKKRSLLHRSLSDEEFENLPGLDKETMTRAVEQGRKAREAADAAAPHPNVTVKARFK